MKKGIICFILGGIIFGTIGVYATYKYQATDVGYTPENSNFKVDNVEGAIDELYKEVSKNKPKLFSTDSWETIILAVREGNTSVYNIGDRKEIDMGSLGVHTVRIANKSTPSECSNSNFSQTACGFVLEFEDIITTHNMNSTNTNVGGWPSSEMRTYIINTIYASLPIVLKDNIINTTVISGHGPTSGETDFISIDKLFLLSPTEIGGGWGGYDSSSSKTRLLDYYEGKDSTYRIKYLNGVATSWYYRSAFNYRTDLFIDISEKGGDTGNHYASNVRGVSPAFRIG